VYNTKPDSHCLNLDRKNSSLDKESANEYAAGNINPETGSKENSLPWIQLLSV
jgi:hypothetical protein